MLCIENTTIEMKQLGENGSSGACSVLCGSFSSLHFPPSSGLAVLPQRSSLGTLTARSSLDFCFFNFPIKDGMT
ncbi:hypothetical protein Y1Q_0021037 [Alligator mississippiensis]|uniref:Uncharacterized protein n=1 Tax=Alligator mississippiensis TaxID=8496 RepID=A0A151M5J4_ALLMI|nr:hypothetical protein Y1Q_0021037 [Alligator mississippiensis]